MFQSLCQNRTFNNFTQSEINIYTKIRWMRILRTYFLHSGSEVEYLENRDPEPGPSVTAFPGCQESPL